MSQICWHLQSAHGRCFASCSVKEVLSASQEEASPSSGAGLSQCARPSGWHRSRKPSLRAGSARKRVSNTSLPLKKFRERTISKSYMCVLPAVTEETARRWPPRSDSRAQESRTSKSVTASPPNSAVDFGTAGMENYHHEKILVYRLWNSIQFFQHRGTSLRPPRHAVFDCRGRARYAARYSLLSEETTPIAIQIDFDDFPPRLPFVKTRSAFVRLVRTMP
jgi:hypothetical protein